MCLTIPSLVTSQLDMGIFQLNVENNPGLHGFASLCCLNGQENSHILSTSQINDLVARVFPRFRVFLVFPWSSHWFFTTLNRKALYPC